MRVTGRCRQDVASGMNSENDVTTRHVHSRLVAKINLLMAMNAVANLHAQDNQKALRAELDAVRHALELAEARLQSYKVELGRNTGIAVREAWSGSRDVEIEWRDQELKSQATQLQLMLSSRSWKMTAPLRTVSAWLGLLSRGKR